MKDWTTCDGQGRLDREPTIPRREMMAAGLAGLVWWMGSRPALAQASFQVKPDHDNILVVIFLRGGADGVNIIAPYAEDLYYKTRPTLALKAPGKGAESLVKLDDLFGLHPALGALEGFYKEGTLAGLHAVGSGDQTRSHFEAMSTMERGLDNENDSAGGGWLGRHLRATPGSNSPLRAVAVSSVLPDSLGGATGALAIENLSDYRLGDPAMMSDLVRLYGQGDDAMSQAGRDTLAVLKRLNLLKPDTYQPSKGVVYPETNLAKALKQTAFLIKNDLGMEVACLDMGLWDTHVTQGAATGWQATLLKELGDAMAAFAKDMGRDMKRVTVVVQTEFGRRIRENSGLGTDHGRGSIMFLMGGGVKGGKVYGDWPTLAQDDTEWQGDLPVTTDYRDVLAEVLSTRLRTADPAKVFPSRRLKPVGIMGV
jgi:uncharacterized protein (DUF1501 family)